MAIKLDCVNLSYPQVPKALMLRDYSGIKKF